MVWFLSALDIVFRYEVTRGSPADTTGLNVAPNALRTEGGSSIIGVSDRIPAVSGLSDYAAILPAHKIDPTAPLTGGVCARTPAIIPAIMALASQDPAGAPANCSEVTEQKLRTGIAAGGGTFNLNLHGLKLSSLKSGDFDWLNGMQTLNLNNNQLTSLPTRLFEGLNGMQTLNLRNNQLTSLPTRLFEGLNGIQTLNLGHNQLTSLPTRLFEELETLQRIMLESNQLTSLAKDTFAGTPNLIDIDLRVNRLGAGGLPDGIFEPLTKLLAVRLQGNPGTKSFKPMADAGEGRTVSAGETVTLSGTSTGPWGSNVTYAWRQLSATGEPVSTVELSATDVAEPTFNVPVLDEETTVKLELKLRGRGTFGETHTSQPSEAVFTIKRLAVTGFTAASSPTGGTHYGIGETLEIAASFSDKVIVDTSGGTPRLALAIGASVGNPNRNAEYVRGSGTTELIFAYTVMRMDADNTGVSIAQNGLKANGGNITSVYGAAAPLAHASVREASDEPAARPRNDTERDRPVRHGRGREPHRRAHGDAVEDRGRRRRRRASGVQHRTRSGHERDHRARHQDHPRRGGERCRDRRLDDRGHGADDRRGRDRGKHRRHDRRRRRARRGGDGDVHDQRGRDRGRIGNPRDRRRRPRGPERAKRKRNSDRGHELHRHPAP